MDGVKPTNSHRSLFKRFEILTLSCEYTFSLMNFMVNKHYHFPTNSHLHSVNARKSHDLHKPAANLPRFQ
jgi:hypothetical protein